MTRLERILQRLPSLYRPEHDDPSLPVRYLAAMAHILEELHEETTEVLQSHWFGYADRGHFHPHLVRLRELTGEDPPPPDALANHPHVDDLARLAGLLPLAPWERPASLRETVEAYRARIGRWVEIFRDGLATPRALRRAVAAQLPPDPEDPRREGWPFTLEEGAPLVAGSLEVTPRGIPSDKVGPLARWTVHNQGLRPVLPTIYIEGVEPIAGEVDATENPLVELLADGEGNPPVGLAYQGTLSAGQTLRLAPAYSSWLGVGDGLLRARSRPDGEIPAHPDAPGPWRREEEGPTGEVTALLQTRDRMLWVAEDGDDGGALWRYDGRSWTAVLTGLDPPRCLAEQRSGAGEGAEDRRLLLGTAGGLLILPLYPEDGLFAATPVAGLEDREVLALASWSDRRWIMGTAEGLRLWNARTESAARPIFFTEARGTALTIHHLSRDSGGVVFLGTELGVFQLQPRTRRWYWYAGGERSQQEAEWRPFPVDEDGNPGELPTEEDVFLPPVRSVLRGPDTSLWLGTDRGIARYLARPVRGTTYETVLEAFPELTDGPVHAILEDARGGLWFGTDRGLLRFDGRDWWQPRGHGESWERLGPVRRGETGEAWRFSREADTWQRWNESGWSSAETGTVTSARSPVFALGWTDQVEAELGTRDGDAFTATSGVGETKLQVRVKPRDDRIVDGGLPAVPRLPVGRSEWRYLRRLPDDAPEPEGDRPCWTAEGRLLPPPDSPAPWPGRWSLPTPPPESLFGEAVFAYPPAARVRFDWREARPLAVLVRLAQESERETTSPETGEVRTMVETLDPAHFDRVWRGIQKVRPAGVRVQLAVDEQIVRGRDDG